MSDLYSRKLRSSPQVSGPACKPQKAPRESIDPPSAVGALPAIWLLAYAVGRVEAKGAVQPKFDPDLFGATITLIQMNAVR